MISIITTFFNAEKFIEANLRSVQSIESQHMIEHVLVDDGSTDHSNKIVSRYVSKNVSLISKGRLGRARALNMAISKSKFRYLCILDADDLINPEWISNFIENKDIFLNSNNNTAVFFGGIKIIDSKLRNVVYKDINPLDLKYRKYNSNKIFFHNPICHSGVIIDKDSFMGAKIYNEQRKAQLDWDLWFKIIGLGKSFLEFDCIATAKRIHAGQFYERKTRIKYLFSSMILQLSWTTKLRVSILPFVLIACTLRFFWGFMHTKLRTDFHDSSH